MASILALGGVIIFLITDLKRQNKNNCVCEALLLHSSVGYCCVLL